MIAGSDTARPPIDLVQLQEIDSTSSEAARRLDAGVNHEFAIIAQSQSAGRGRHGHKWVSPAGNLFLSVVIHPGIGTDRAGELAFVSAIAVGRALASLNLLHDIRYKWPNDILADDAKLCGILVENRIEGAQVAASIIGIGVNVEQAPANMPYPVTSLTECGAGVACEALAHTILVQLQELRRQWSHDGFTPIAAEWNRTAWHRDRRVTVDNGVDRLTGILAGLSEHGALTLVTETGTTEIYSGSLLYQDAA